MSLRAKFKNLCENSNPYKVHDKAKEKVEMKKNVKRKDSKLKPIEHQLFETEFNKKGDLEYLLFRTRHEGKNHVRVMRLFRVLGVSNEIRVKSDNLTSFKNILNDFSKNVSFVVLYAGEGGRDNIISYGILMEGKESELEKIISESRMEMNALEKSFRSAYNNIDIAKFTHHDEWVFNKFYSKYFTVVRGIPHADDSMGSQTGTTYSSPPQMERQVSEVILKGMNSKTDENGIAVGDSFLMYCVLDPIERDEIKRKLETYQNYLGQTDSSTNTSMGENENFSLPLIFGFGLGEMFGETTASTEGVTEGVVNSTGQTNTETLAKGQSDMIGESKTNTQGTGIQEGSSVANQQGKGGNVGASLVVQDTWNWSEGSTETESTSFSSQASVAEGENQSHTKTESESQALAISEQQSESKSATASKSMGETAQKGSSLSGAGGVNIGNGMNIARQIKDHFQEYSSYILKLNEERYRKAAASGAFDSRMIVLTDDEESKKSVERLIKQAYLDDEKPIPIRICEFTKEEEKEMSKYAKTLAKPTALETNQMLLDKHRYSTYWTTHEAAAFNLPQDNLRGYDSSFDPMPPSIANAGQMEDGAEVGIQWDRNLNQLSGHPFKIPKKQLGHIGIFGGTGQGKTVFTQKFVSSVHNKYDINFLLFDWAKNHRSLMNHVNNSKKFRFNSFQADLFPLKVNLLQPPKGVPHYVWDPVVSELFCYSTGLGGRSYLIIIDCLNSLRERFKNTSQEATILDLIDQVALELESRTEAAGGRLGFKEQETFSSMRDRFKIWTYENRPVFEAMCKPPFVGFDELVKGDFVHLVECNQLPKDARKFVINTMAAGVFQYCSQRDEKLKKPTYMIFEEAHTVLSQPTGNEPLPIDETVFETMSREARNYNLFIGYICQSPETLPPLIFDNLPIRAVFQMADNEGKSKIISAAGRDAVRLDVDLVKWLSMQPRGTCLMRMSNYDKLQEGQLKAIKCDMLFSEEMTDSFFRRLYNKKNNANVKVK